MTSRAANPTLPSQPQTTQLKTSPVLTANRAALFLTLFPGIILGLATSLLPIGIGLALFIVAGVTLLTLALFFRQPLRVLRADTRVQTRPDLPLAVLTALLAIVASEGVIFFLGTFAPNLVKAVPQLLPSSWLDLIPLALAAVIAVPLYEEFVMRGLALRAYAEVRTPLFSLLLTSVLFALIHGSPAQILAVLPAALIFGLAVQRSGSLWTSVVAHGLFNGIAIIAAQFGMYEVGHSVGVALVGGAVATLTTMLAVRLLGGLPSAEPRGQGSLWSASLIAVIVIGILSALVTSVIVFFPGVFS